MMLRFLFSIWVKIKNIFAIYQLVTSKHINNLCSYLDVVFLNELKKVKKNFFLFVF